MICVSVLTSRLTLACEAITLSQATNRAAEKTRDGHPLAALSCYREFRDHVAFDNADLTTQERFLSEYLDHCRNLARHAHGALRKTYWQEAHDIAESYVEWHAACRPPQRRAIQHVRAVMFYLGDADLSLQQPERVLIDYERLAPRLPNAFGTQAVELWEETLRTVPGATRYLEDAEARDLVIKNSSNRRHWEAFRAFLRTVESAPEMTAMARDYLGHLHAILGE